MKRKKWIVLSALGIIVLIIIGLWVMASQPTKVSQSETTRSSKQRTLTRITGHWQGVKQYPDQQSVTLKLTLRSDKTYQLIEQNTVSQCWTRTYAGHYTRQNQKITCIPETVKVTTYGSKQAMKNQQPSASETVIQTDFHKQFGNQQHSKITISHRTLVIDHDHEHVILKAQS